VRSAAIASSFRPEVVKPEVYARSTRRPRSSFQIAVVMKIRPGFTLTPAKNRRISHRHGSQGALRRASPAAKFLSKGKLEKFTFSKIPLNVYQDTVTLRMPFRRSRTPSWRTTHPLKLRYQACSTNFACPGHPYSRRNAEHGGLGSTQAAHAEILESNKLPHKRVCGCSSVVGRSMLRPY